ncbi:hypothetical protein RJ639_001025 [Escallonia herrerae]|uniref:Uncharacterized protein n=1 Tax=Escallonia herrerae TaxID=1293975 RepID=A0AA88XE37_9ASTE|nr:hypothetical protein RJ639_001025 [Escallonia herrerae]
MSSSSSSLVYGANQTFQSNLKSGLSSSMKPCFAGDYGLLSLRINRMAHTELRTRMKGWILGMLLSMVIPLCRHKLNPFLALKNKVDSVVETAEIVLDVVEKVADEVLEVADGFGDKLPEGGKLKGAVDLVENIAREIAKDAHLAGNLIDKVEEAEKEVESLVEPVILHVSEANKEKAALQD